MGFSDGKRIELGKMGPQKLTESPSVLAKAVTALGGEKKEPFLADKILKKVAPTGGPWDAFLGRRFKGRRAACFTGGASAHTRGASPQVRSQPTTRAHLVPRADRLSERTWEPGRGRGPGCCLIVRGGTV